MCRHIDRMTFALVNITPSDVFAWLLPTLEASSYATNIYDVGVHNKPYRVFAFRYLMGNGDSYWLRFYRSLIHKFAMHIELHHITNVMLEHFDKIAMEKIGYVISSGEFTVDFMSPDGNSERGCHSLRQVIYQKNCCAESYTYHHLPLCMGWAQPWHSDKSLRLYVKDEDKDLKHINNSVRFEVLHHRPIFTRLNLNRTPDLLNLNHNEMVGFFSHISLRNFDFNAMTKALQKKYTSDEVKAILREIKNLIRTEQLNQACRYARNFVDRPPTIIRPDSKLFIDLISSGTFEDWLL